MSFLSNLKTLVTGEPKTPGFKRLSKRDLIRMESAIGAKLFGPIPRGHRREFFCLDEHAWVWYEEWVDPNTKKRHSVTTRYEIHDKGILKIQDGQPYQEVQGEELRNLVTAIQLYYEQVARNVYRFDPHTGKPIDHQPAKI